MASKAAATVVDLGQAEAGGATKSKKKLIIIVAALAVLLAAGAAGALVFMQQQKAKALAEEDEDEPSVSRASAKDTKKDPKALPVFMPLDPFTVNLADRNANRYAQMTVSLEVESGKTGDRVRGFMPVIRNNMLFVLSRKTAADINHIDGKELLARELHIAALKAIGADTTALEPAPAASGAAAARKKRRETPPPPPILAVHFSTLIIQ